MFEEAASEVELALGRDHFGAHLRGRLTLPAAAPIHGAIRLVPSLTRGPAITTNFDLVLERVFEQSGFPFPGVGRGPQVDAVWGALHQDKPFLLKLHGDLAFPSSRVLTLKEYQGAYGSRDAGQASSNLPLPRLLEQIFTSRTILFLGCSLTMDRTLAYMQRVRREHGAPAQHFAILPAPPDEATFFARVRFLEDLNIRAVWYPPGRHELIESLLERAMEPRLIAAAGRQSHAMPPGQFDENERPGTSNAPQPTSEKSPVRRMLAIDFGTSFSAVALAGEGPELHFLSLIPNSDAKLIPTVVRFFEGLQYTIGEGHGLDSGKALIEIRNFKRFLGSAKTYRVGRRDYTSVQVVTLFLKGLRNRIASKLNGDVPRVIASVPANFDVRQTAELSRAFRIAGFEVQRIIAEPCAAALNGYDDTSGKSFSTLVVDMGGGTTDVSVVECSTIEDEKQFSVLSVAGDNFLGGMDFDDLVCQLLLDALIKKFGPGGKDLYERHQRMLESQAPAIKIALNYQPTAAAILADVEIKPGELGVLYCEVDKDSFLAKAAPLFRRLEKLVEDAVGDAFGLSLEKLRKRGWKSPEDVRPRDSLSAVMLAGQSSKQVAIRDLLKEKIGLPIIDQFQDIAVTRGLARQAAVLCGRLADMLLLDATYRGIYLRVPSEFYALREAEFAGAKYQDFTLRDVARSGVNFIRDTDGRSFMCLQEKHVTIPSFRRRILVFGEPLNSIVLELFDDANTLPTRFHLIERLQVRFVEPAKWVDVIIDVDANREVRLHFRCASEWRPRSSDWRVEFLGEKLPDERIAHHLLGVLSGRDSGDVELSV